MQQRQAVLKPIRNPQYMVRDLRALPVDEINRWEDEYPCPGNRVGGIGLVRVQNTKEVNWVYIRCNDVILENCPRHPDIEMSLERVLQTSNRNLQDTVFMRCNEGIATSDEGLPVGCGFNVYFVYRQDKLLRELALPPDESPVMIYDPDRRAAAARIPPRVI